MRRVALSILGFSGAFTPLMSLGWLREAVDDGLDGVRLPPLSNLVLNLAPFGLTLWIVPALVAIGVYLRTGKKPSASDAFWAILGAVLVFSSVTGALLASFNQFLFLGRTRQLRPFYCTVDVQHGPVCRSRYVYCDGA